MRKLTGIICALSLLLCVGYTSFGKRVDEQTAKTVGSNFLISMGINGIAGSADLSKAYEAVANVNGTAITAYFVFNFVGHNGFVMVAADDIIEPILAYSSEAPFNINNMSPAAKDWVEGYQNQITYVIQNQIPSQPGVADSWSHLMKTPIRNFGAKTTVTFPSSSSWLLTTTWDQAPNYNYLCPGSGASKAVTGCVATAMAQVMKYWNWPTVGTGLHTYTPASYSALTANFGNTTYNWSGMPNSISSNNNAIGTLMLHCGISVDMNYGSSSSGAYVIHEYSPSLHCTEYALKTYFRYKSTLKGLSRSATASGTPAISQSDWVNYLKNELNAQRPVIYSGQGTSGGHAWVADGYDASGLMHFNWGWGGVGPNGFYTVNAIAPPSLGIGGGGGNFNSQQAIIIGVMPDSSGSASTAGNIQMQTRLNCTTPSPIDYLGSFSVTAKIRNTNTTVFNGDFCAMAFDVNGKYVGTLQTLTGQTIAAGDSTATLTFNGANMYGMVPGTIPDAPSYYLAIANNYGIRIMYRPTGSGLWTSVANNGAFINYNQMGVIGSAISMRLHDSLNVGSRTVAKGAPLSISTKIANFGTSGFSGTIRAYLFNVHTGASFDLQTKTGQSIGAGSFASHTFSTTSLNVPGGTYALAIQHQPGATGSFIVTGNARYLNPVLIDVVGSAAITVPEFVADKVNVYPNPAASELFVDTKGAKIDALHIIDITGRSLRTMTGFDNQDLVKVPVADIASGVYFIQLHSGDQVVVKKIVVAK